MICSHRCGDKFEKKLMKAKACATNFLLERFSNKFEKSSDASRKPFVLGLGRCGSFVLRGKRGKAAKALQTHSSFEKLSVKLFFFLLLIGFLLLTPIKVLSRPFKL